MNHLSCRATVRIRNNSMLESREAAGISQRTLAELTGVNINDIGKIESFDFSIANAVEKARKISVALYIPVESIIPEERAGEKLWTDLSVIRNLEVSMLTTAKQQLMLEAPKDEKDIDYIKDKISMLRECLTEREKLIIDHRFGFDGKPTLVYEEIGKKLKITRERVRQVETSAIRKMEEKDGILSRRIP